MIQLKSFQNKKTKNPPKADSCEQTNSIPSNIVT